MSIVEEKSYTVKEVSALAQVTIKALHHYDAIGLLKPSKLSSAGYRLYGHAELQRLQEILFYRELAIPLKKISLLLQGTADRTSVLKEQRILLRERRQRLDSLLQTLDTSIQHAEKGIAMEATTMFKGFATEQEWKEALSEQNNYLKSTYDVDISKDTVDPEKMNQAAHEATDFMQFMATAIRDQQSHDDAEVQTAIKKHVAFLNAHGHKTLPRDYVAQTKFLMNDTFHRSIMETQQVGLSYYLVAAAEVFSKSEKS